MQNSTPENGNQGQSAAQPNQAPAAASGGLQSAVQQQADNLGNAAKEQVANVGQQAQAQMQNLGQVGMNQVENLGKAGVAGIGNMVGQFTQPMANQTPQPPVRKEEKVYASIAYLPFVSLLSVIVKPDSAFVRLHAKQGIVLTLIFFFVGMFAAIISIFGVVGQLLALLLGLVPVACIIIGIYSMYLAMTGYWWKIPVLGSVADLIPIEMLAKASKENITGQVGIAKNDYDNRQDTLTQENIQNAPTPVQPVQPSNSTPANQGNVPPSTPVK